MGPSTAKRRTYTSEFRREAVRLVLEQGLIQTRVAWDLGAHRTVVRDWVRKARASSGAASHSSSSAVDEENRRLCRENAILREERETPRKTAAFFAQKTW